MNFDELLEDIVDFSDSIRFVFFTNEEGKIVHSKVATTSFLLDKSQASVLGVDMQILRRLLKLYGEIIGHTSSLHMVAEKVHVLIFYVENWTVLVSCDRDTDRHVLADLMEQIGALLESRLN
ncbi:MAG TPA: hypothetical protein VJ792_08645 [Candidatus Nitrosotalea sp.]|nr:hypothetical protein [Candidatus Nitrosotalea sp.]